METKMKKKQRAPKGSKAVRKEKRGGKLVWGYHVWLRQPDGSRKQVRDFSFTTQDEAKEALRAIQTAGRKERYGLVEPKKQLPTTIQTAVTRYRDLSQSKRIHDEQKIRPTGEIIQATYTPSIALAAGLKPNGKYYTSLKSTTRLFNIGCLPRFFAPKQRDAP